MASYGYGYGSAQSQGYSTVHPQSSFTAQASSGYGGAFGGTTGPRQMVQQGYDANAGYGYGYGRQQNSQSSVIPSSHQSTYGTSSFMSRDAGGFDATKSNYGYGSGSQGSYMYNNQNLKQTGTYGGNSMYASGQYGSGQTKQPANQSFMSQTGSSSAGYVGYGSVRSQSGASAGYSSASQAPSGGGYSSVSSTSANNAQQKPRQVIPKPQQQQGQQQQQQPNPQSSNTYDSVILNAATSFLSQQGQQQKAPWQRQPKPQFRLQNERRQGPRPQQQLLYCDVCKISCAGQMTYKEHLEGQKHKKKAASQVTTTKETLPSGSYKCELCDVTCTGIDAYDAHLKGARHVKTVKLHQKLGKPIPEFKTPEQITAEEKKSTTDAPKKVIQRPGTKVATAPKINFVGGTKLLSTSPATNQAENSETSAEGAVEEDESAVDVQDNNDTIVGEEYIEDVKSDVGKVIGYKCTLCDCRFNDVVARTAHVKGRRHRLNYKKKVQPSLRVDMKGSRRTQIRLQRGMVVDRRLREQEVAWRARQQQQIKWEQELRMREEELKRWEEEEYFRRVEEDRYWTRPDRNLHELEHYELERKARYFDSPGGRSDGLMQMTPDDKLIMAKHNSIYPTEEELKQVQNIVGTTEKALKLVSDEIAEEDQKAIEEESKTEENKEKSGEAAEVKKEEGSEEGSKTDESKQDLKKPLLKPNLPRTLKGVMRVGSLAKGLLLHGSLDVELVVLCNDKPTLKLLRRVAEKLPAKIQKSSEEKFDVTVDEAVGSIDVSTQVEPKCVINIKLTSPVIREEVVEESEKATSADSDVLNKEKCLEALASLRHAKWFQARANGVQFCVIIIRIMRDLCNRIPAFQVLSGWAIELLVEKSLSSGPCPGGPAEALRRVLEVISSGLFLPGSCGLLDPCEKETVDAGGAMTDQEREDLTAGAQHALRLHAFKQLHTVLDIDPLKIPQRGRGNSRSKRRRDDSRDKSSNAKVQKKEDEKAEPVAMQE